ncbi:hypothetical protein BDD12DRAFT_864086 [Trichophaea hybrida]|nr:hypothetical protein BDD12DRAFT_864086 [Trichophaea hybrida]
MSPYIASPSHSPSSSCTSLSEPRLESAHLRNQILQGIAKRQGIVQDLECDYIAWRLPPIKPTKPPIEARGKAKGVQINLLALCSPGAAIFSSGGKHAHFSATPETRCVRDIKRPFSWKVYGVSCNPSEEKAHYVRIQFSDHLRDSQFKPLVTLLDSISAKRHVALPNISPFGLGVDYGVPSPHSTNRIFCITHCAKTTPFLRKVSVDFEIFLGSQWKRVDMKVDRLGFAVYKSALKSHILLSDGPEDIHFSHDPYVRFARMTLRFGDRPERTYIDIEHSSGQEKPCVVNRTKKESIVYIPAARVRTCDIAGSTKKPVRTMVRLIFHEEKSAGMAWSRGAGVAAAAEAEKAASLIRKTTRLAVQNPIGIKSTIRDRDIYSMQLKGVVSERGYTVTNAEDGHTFQADIRDKFKESVVYAVPSLRTGRSGIVLISQSRDGEAVLRQHIDNPISLITSITARGFGVPCNSTLVRAKDGSKSIGKGMIRYSFNYGEADAAVLIDKLVNLYTSIDSSKLLELQSAMERKHQQRSQRSNPPSPSPPPISSPTTPHHARSSSNISNLSTVSGYSEISNASTVDECGCTREPSDWDIYEEAEQDEIEVIPPLSTPGKALRTKQDFAKRVSREVEVNRGDVVLVEFKNEDWSFVRLGDGTQGWMPTKFLDIGVQS